MVTVLVPPVAAVTQQAAPPVPDDGAPYVQASDLADCVGLALGSLLASFASDPEGMRRHRRWMRPGLALIALGSLGYLVGARIRSGPVDFAQPQPFWPGLRILVACVLYFGVVGLVISYSGHRALAPLRSSVLGWLGGISYSLYILHIPLYVSIDSIVRRLETAGLIDRQPHPDDGRAVLAVITPKGRALVERATKDLVAADFGLEALDEPQLRELSEILRPIRAAAGDF